MDRTRIALMTRLPVEGVSKTRLIPELGAAGAARLQREMSEHVARQLRLLREVDGWLPEARIAGGTATEARRWLHFLAVEQGEGDLGARQAAALRDGLRDARVAMVVGGDCPTVDAADMREAAAAARANGAAFVAATDGGYCLLAVRDDLRYRVSGLLGEGIDWGGPEVLRQTRARFAAAGVMPAVLGPRDDIDQPADLAAWEAVRAAWYGPPRALSVVVPTLNDAGPLASLLEALAPAPVEIVVADGGSVDGTIELARAAGAVVIETARGRGMQLDAGGRAATGDALLFLHADTIPPEGFATLVTEALTDPGLVLGAFRFSVAARSTALRVIEAGTGLRGSVLHFPYGDQGLFCRAAVWRALGGFAHVPVMEDFDLVSRARKAGAVRVLPQAAITSDRAWRDHGVLRWTALNVATVLRYRAGWSPERLEEWRRRT